MHITPQPPFGQGLDSIVIENIRARAIIGVIDWERKIAQNICISLTLKVDMNKSAHSDDLNDTVDYDSLTTKIIAMVETSRYHLIEKLAAEVAKYVLAHFAVDAILVRLEKPAALRHAKTVGVEIYRTRRDFNL